MISARPQVIAVSWELNWIQNGLMIAGAELFQSTLYSVSASFQMDQLDYGLCQASIFFYFYQWHFIGFLFFQHQPPSRLSVTTISFYLLSNVLSQALQGVASNSHLDAYMLALGAQSISHLLFIDDCLLGRASIQNGIVFFKILEEYYQASRQRVNHLKFTVTFSPKMNIQLGNTIK